MQSRRSESNRCALDYESSALPAELRRRETAYLLMRQSVPRLFLGRTIGITPLVKLFTDNALDSKHARSVTDDRFSRENSVRAAFTALPLASSRIRCATRPLISAFFASESVPKLNLSESPKSSRRFHVEHGRCPIAAPLPPNRVGGR